MQEDAQFENSQMMGGQANCNKCGKRCGAEMIEWQVDCNECGNRCKKTHNLKIHKCNKCGMNYCRKKQILRSENDRIASGLQSMLKEMQDNAKFQNQKMIEWLVDCNECGNRCNRFTLFILIKLLYTVASMPTCTYIVREG